MNLEIFTYTNKGGKQINEDYLEYVSNDRLHIFVLADGLGGHGNGDIAAKIVTQTLLSEISKVEEPSSDHIQNSFDKANETLKENQEKLNYSNMKTTAVALCISETKALWGHLGDSRLYYLSNNEIHEVTQDHSVTFKKFLSGETTYQDINLDDDRSSLLRVFGSREKGSAKIVDQSQSLKEGDAFLLCSDGFWEYLYNEEILVDFLKSDTPKQWADFMLLRHIQRIKPFNDNYSLITIFVKD